MEQTNYDVFISYRRKGGSEKAQLVKSEIKLRGVEEERIFLDTHNLHEGDFEPKIKIAVEQSQCVVVVISNGCFDEVKETDFWYVEIKEALLQGKKVVPILFDGITSFASLNVPKDLMELTKKNAVTYQHEYANAAFDKLITFIGHREETVNICKRRGCLVSLKYKGCLVSVTFTILVCFVLVPMTFFLAQQGIKTAKSYKGNVDIKTDTGEPLIYPARSATRELVDSLNEVKSLDEVLSKIAEYLSHTKSNEVGQKVITCFWNDTNKVRICFFENNEPKVNKLLLGVKTVTNLAEYDIQAMQEEFFRGSDGIEYVSFIIPRFPQYILNGKYVGRIYECMIFNVPKDIEGRWEKFKDYLIAFINDILDRPGQLWDEYVFQRGLEEMDINMGDVSIIEQYMFN